MIRKTLLAFDMDGTLAKSKDVQLCPKHKKLLKDLYKNNYKILIISSGGCKRIVNQIRLNIDYHIVGNYGLERATVVNGKLGKIQYDYYSENDKEVTKKVSDFRDSAGFTEYKGDSVIIYKTGLICIPLIGNSDEILVQERHNFDPDHAKRISNYPKLKKFFNNYDIYNGGRTCYDIIRKGYDKYYALKNYCSKNNIQLDEVLFCGNEFFKIGNDYPIKAHNVDHIELNNYKDLTSQLKERGIKF